MIDPSFKTNIFLANIQGYIGTFNSFYSMTLLLRCSKLLLEICK